MSAATKVKQIVPTNHKSELERMELEGAQLDFAIRELLSRKQKMLEQVKALEGGLQSLDARVKGLASKRTLALNFTLPLGSADALRNEYATAPAPIKK